MKRGSVTLVTAAVALTLTSCMRLKSAALQPAPAPEASLWKAPDDLASRDTYYGPWGAEHAPDPSAIYTFVEQKHSGVNPGFTVRDPEGQEWSVKQPEPGTLDDEGPVEVTMSRILSAVGYHQPPVYYLRTFTLKNDWGTHTSLGGRFRLKHQGLKDLGPWAWQQNPFVGTKPYQGLLVLMLMFNSTDIKDGNNSLYQYRSGDSAELWYSVRDIGAALGDTLRLVPLKGDPDAFERTPFILGVSNGYVQFGYTGWYKKLTQNRLTPDDVIWASKLLSQLSDAQWNDAFRAGGFDAEVALRFIRKLKEKIEVGLASDRLPPPAAAN